MPKSFPIRLTPSIEQSRLNDFPNDVDIQAGDRGREREIDGHAALPLKRFVGWLALGTSKFYDWRKRYGQVNEHNALVPRDDRLEAWEKQAILDFHDRHRHSATVAIGSRSAAASIGRPGARRHPGGRSLAPCGRARS